MSQVAPVFTCECRGSEAAYSSQATPTKHFPGEFEEKHVARCLSFPVDVQYSLANTTFLGKQQQKRHVACSNRVATHRVPRKRAALAQQQVSTPTTWTPVINSGIQHVLPSYRLLQFFPDMSVNDTDIESPCTGNTHSVCHKPNNQDLLGPIRSARTAYHRSSNRPAPYSVPTSPFSRPQTIESPYSVVKDILEADNETDDALIAKHMSQLLAEALDLADAFERGEICYEKPTESSRVTETMATGVICSESVTVTPVVEKKKSGGVKQTDDALIAMHMTQLLAESLDLADAFERGEIRLEKPAESSRVTETMTTDVTCSENVTVTPVAEEEKKSGGEKQAYVWCSLQNLDLSDTEALFDGTYNDMDINSIYDMYLPPEVPSTDINELRSSKEFLELKELIDNIKQESRGSSETVATQRKSVQSPSKGVSGHSETSRDPLDNYVPDMFLFSTSQQEVKFDLFDIHPVDSMDLHSDVTSSRKRKRCPNDDVVSKRRKVSCRTNNSIVKIVID